MANKKTLKDYFGELRVLAETEGRADLVKFIDGRIVQIEKKNASKTTRQTATQKANAEYAEIVVNLLLGETKPLACAEIAKAMPSANAPANGWSTQKMAPILAKLVEDERVKVETVKGRKVYSI